METGRLRRKAGIIGLMFSSLGSIIGSGWLFGSLHASRLAGPLSIWSWIIGGVIILLLSGTFAELGTMFPKSGALVHMSHVSHGHGFGHVWGWILLFYNAAIPPVEAIAVLTYANNYLPYFVYPQSGVLTPIGFLSAVALLGLFVVINVLAVQWLFSVNTAATWWKLIVPALTVVVLLIASFHPGNLHVVAKEESLTGVLKALPAAGVVFSYLGFRTAIDLAGESQNPGRTVPIAVVGSVLLAVVLYAALQAAFILCLPPSYLAHGWEGLTFSGVAGPFAGLAVGLGVVWWGVVLYIDAFVSPAGTGLIYLAGGSRVAMAIGHTGGGPDAFGRIGSKGVPWIAVLVVFAIGTVFLLPFPSWTKMVNYITSVGVLTYGIGPIVLIHLRRSHPEMARPFRLWGANVLAPAAFIASNWVMFWSGFGTDWILFALAFLVLAVYGIYHHSIGSGTEEPFGWRHIGWLVPYFGGMLLLSYLGPTELGGIGRLSLGWDMLVIAVFSLFVIWLALISALSPEATRAEVEAIVALKESEGVAAL